MMKDHTDLFKQVRKTAKIAGMIKNTKVVKKDKGNDPSKGSTTEPTNRKKKTNKGTKLCFITLGKGINRANYEMSKQVRNKVDYKQIFPLQSAAGCNDRQKHYW